MDPHRDSEAAVDRKRVVVELTPRRMQSLGIHRRFRLRAELEAQQRSRARSDRTLAGDILRSSWELT